GLETLLRPLELGGFAAQQHQMRAFGGETASHHQAQAARSPGDDDDAVGEGDAEPGARQTGGEPGGAKAGGGRQREFLIGRESSHEASSRRRSDSASRGAWPPTSL